MSGSDDLHRRDEPNAVQLGGKHVAPFDSRSEPDFISDARDADRLPFPGRQRYRYRDARLATRRGLQAHHDFLPHLGRMRSNHELLQDTEEGQMHRHGRLGVV